MFSWYIGFAWPHGGLYGRALRAKNGGFWPEQEAAAEEDDLGGGGMADAERAPLNAVRCVWR